MAAGGEPGRERRRRPRTPPSTANAAVDRERRRQRTPPPTANAAVDRERGPVSDACPVTPVDTKSAAIGGTRPRNGRDETLPF
ncbi:hypothetical protein [Halorubrum distributum]|uniref:Uncharacterized protein n=1 Tax=Halorubrum distributum TaxID=29283 RepID=A0A6B1IVV5_9EURY|nr:hypothetical protein [Halorubrum terrestre]MYL66896.1 hypothetical protein [Halorubrum terrestre]